MDRLCLLALPVLALSLANQSFAQPIDRTKPPVSPQPKPYKLPPTSETKLPNGLTVILAEDARLPLATLRLAFLGGNKRDPADIPGLAAFVASMLPQGTATRTYKQIAEELDAAGAEMSASTSADALSVSGSVLAENLPKLLNLLSDITRNSSFPESELALQKRNRAQTLNVQHSQPAYLANEEFRSLVFGNQPYAHVGPTSASIDKVTRQTLVDFRDTLLVPNNAYLVVVGKLGSQPALLKTISDEFGSWQQKPVPAYTPPAPPPSKRQVVLVDRPGSVQADMRLGKVGATYRDPEFFPQALASLILGGPSSRLFTDIREKRGYAYDVHTEVGAFADSGTFSTVTQVRNEVVADALTGILEHLDRMAAEPVTGQELTDAKAYATGIFVLGLEPQAGLADRIAQMKVMGQPADYLEMYTTRINSVEPQQIQAAAKKSVSSEGAAIVVVGDSSKIQDALDKIPGLGKTEVVKPPQ